MIGGLPVTSVIVRGSVNVHAGAESKLSAIFHGILLLVSVMFLPLYLNYIPLSCLGAILLVTGIKLASPALVKRMWSEGRYQFIPFMATRLEEVTVLRAAMLGAALVFAVYPLTSSPWTMADRKSVV